MQIPEAKVFKAQLGNDTITFETSKVGMLAGGTVVVKMGESVVMVHATASSRPREGIDFLPLSVDFEEKLYAEGRIPGNFFRREGRPSEDAILTSRLIDRPLRPLFDKSIRNELQVVANAMASDGESHLDIMGINGASAALMISDIPWAGPVGAVRIGLIDGELVVNAPLSAMETSDLDLRIAGTKDAILMVEAGATEVPEAQMLDALRLAHESIQGVIQAQNEMVAAVGKPKINLANPGIDEAIVEKVTAWATDKMAPVLDTTVDKTEINLRKSKLNEEALAAFADDETIAAGDVLSVISSLFKKKVRNRILDEGIRPDGRATDQIRPIWCETGVLPRVHGTGLFTRGETQVMSVVTLGTPSDEQRLDTLFPRSTKRYIHHYNFPPYSVGETGRIGGTKRRETGHGALAERALIPVIPGDDKFSYTIRVVSEVLSSNGSTSMASVCGSSLCLMDAGVPISAPVAGIAMGLITDPETGKFAVLSDIQGVEDALGDMDFKVAGTEKGINALQMDIKIGGIPWDVFEQALAQAHEGRLHILGLMAEAIAEPREAMSPHAPRIFTIKVKPDLIGKIIGPGGKTVRAIQEETGASVDITDDGTIYIATNDGDSADRARIRIEGMVAVPEVGQIYTGKVVRVTDFGAFVEILPGTDGMVHISQLADYRVNAVTDVAQEGDELMVMVTNVSNDGKVRLSRQAVLEGWTVEEARERDKGGKSSGGRRGGGRDRRGGGRGGDRRRS